MAAHFDSNSNGNNHGENEGKEISKKDAHVNHDVLNSIHINAQEYAEFLKFKEQQSVVQQQQQKQETKLIITKEERAKYKEFIKAKDV